VISYLKGRVIDLETDSVTIDVQGVGYDVSCSLNTVSALTEKSEAQLWIYTHVREDIILLCGFASRSEKQLFQSLLKVNGIGPKMALKILSGAPLERIIQMIEDQDTKGLSALPKVGKKTAEQMILTLKGKLTVDEGMSAQRVLGPKQEVMSALVNLGFRIADVEQAVSQMGEVSNVEDGIKKGLAALSSL
jgi:holliday junction DNA helicase RuvA